MALTATVIIPTYNREPELKVCLTSLLRQTVLPSQIIVIDDGNLTAPPLREEVENAGIQYLFLKKHNPGVTASRNLGATHSQGDILFFLDDDVELFPDYLEKIMVLYEHDPQEKIAAVGGRIANVKPMTWARTARWIVNVLFLNSGFREGKMLLSGFCTEDGATPFPPRKPCRVDVLGGGTSSCRKWIFTTISYTEGYEKVARGEDKDFSARISRRYQVMFVPEARLNHFEAESMRPDKRDWARKTVLGVYLLFKNIIKQKWWHWFCFYYALLGYLSIRTAIAIIRFNRKNWSHVAGVLEAVSLIIRGRVPDPVSNLNNS